MKTKHGRGAGGRRRDSGGGGRAPASTETAAAAERETTARFERLHATAVALSAALTPAEVAATAVAHGAALGTAAACAIAVQSGAEVSIIACRGSAERAGARAPSFSIDADLPLAAVLRERRPLFLEGVGGARGPAALAALPLVAGGDAIGAMGIAFDDRRGFDEDDRAFLLAFAHHCAQALDRARLFEAERRARLEAQRAEEAARRALDMRDRLMGIVGHDLRTPLAAIRMSLGLLFRRNDLRPDQARALARIGSSAVRMTRIIRDLLDFSRLSSEGAIPVQLRPADVAAVVRRTVAELQAVHPEREIVVDAPRSAVARVDPDRIGQVVSNLVGNALQHGPPEASVRVTVEPAEGGVLIGVHNGGPAIRGDLSELFEPFRRGAAASEAGSAGLGLFIVREVLRAHGGSVSVVSTDEEGTTFTVRLPAPSATTGRPAPER